MKSVKRFLSLLLTLCLVLGMMPGSALAAAGTLPFADVQTEDWYYEAVQYTSEKGIMGGTSETTFAPNEATTRAMIVTVLYRLENSPAVSGSASFSDVAAGQWYAKAVAWASANGIVNGYGDGKFGPADTITREQMAAILYRYSQYKGYTTTAAGSISAFADAAKVSPYALEAMQWAVSIGLIAGSDNNALDPQGSATRGQIALVLLRYDQNVAATSTTPSKPTTNTTTNKPATNTGSSDGGDGGDSGSGDSGSSGSNPTVSKEITGVTLEKSGNTLTVRVTPADAQFTIKWYGCDPAEGATSYTTTNRDLGAEIYVVVTGAGDYTGEQRSNTIKVDNSITTTDSELRQADSVVQLVNDTYYVDEDTQQRVEISESDVIELKITPAAANSTNSLEILGTTETEQQAALNNVLHEVAKISAGGTAVNLAPEALSQVKDEIVYSAVDVDLVKTVTKEENGEVTTEKTTLHPVGETVVTLSKGALGLKDDVDLETYTFFATHENQLGEAEAVAGEIVEIAGAQYVQFTLNGLSRIYIGNVPPRTVTFDAAGGSPTPEQQKVKFGGFAKKVDPPSKEGFLFTSWDHDLSSENIIMNIKVTAQWIAGSVAPADKLAGQWLLNNLAAQKPEAVEETVADGQVTLLLDSQQSYPGNLSYQLTVAPPTDATGYAVATTGTAAAAATEYTTLNGSNYPVITMPVTDGEGGVKTSSTNLYIKWVSGSGDQTTVLGLQSARLVIRTQQQAAGNYDTQTRVEQRPVDRGLGQVSFYLTDGEKDGQKLPDYVGSLNGYLLPNYAEIKTYGDYILNVYTNFYDSFKYANADIYLPHGYNAVDYKSIKGVITPFAGETFSGTPTVSAYYLHDDGNGKRTQQEVAAQATLTNGQIVITCAKPELTDHDSSLIFVVQLGDRQQEIYFSCSHAQISKKAFTSENWNEIVAALNGDEYELINYSGSEDITLNNPLTIETDKRLYYYGANLTIGNGGVLTIKSDGNMAGHLEIQGQLTVANGGKLETNSQDPNQLDFFFAGAFADKIVVQAGGSIVVPDNGYMELYSYKDSLDLQEGGTIQNKQQLLIRGNDSGDNHVIAGTITADARNGGFLEFNNGVTIKSTGKINVTGSGAVEVGDEYIYKGLAVYGGLDNQGAISLSNVSAMFSGRTDNYGSIEANSNSILYLRNTGYTVTNSGNIEVDSSSCLNIDGTVLVNTGSITGSGRLSAGEMDDFTDYENGIEWVETTGDRTADSYNRYEFVTDPATTVDVIYFQGELDNRDNGSCTLTPQQ